MINNAIFVTWTENAWPAENIKQMYKEFLDNKIVTEEWRVKQFKHAYLGMPVLAYKQKNNRRGIFGIGYINSEAFPVSRTANKRKRPHRDFEIRFINFSDPLSEEGPLLPAVECDQILGDITSSRFSGVVITIDIYNQILKQIKDKKRNHDFNPMPIPLPNKSNFNSKQSTKPLKYKDDRQEDQDYKKELGMKGELYILNIERQKLINANLLDLSKKIKWVSDVDDSAGYDILSYDLNGKEIYIEVKTTAKSINTPFYLSPNELNKSILYKKAYKLYRVFEFGSTPKYYIINGPIEEGKDSLMLRPTGYEVSIQV